jgi:hypothetical protein
MESVNCDAQRKWNSIVYEVLIPDTKVESKTAQIKCDWAMRGFEIGFAPTHLRRQLVPFHRPRETQGEE